MVTVFFARLGSHCQTQLSTADHYQPALTIAGHTLGQGRVSRGVHRNPIQNPMSSRYLQVLATDRHAEHSSRNVCVRSRAAARMFT